MDASLITALEADAVLIVEIVQIDLPGGTLRFVDQGFVVWGADTFDAEDATYGVLSGIEGFETGAIGSPPRLKITILPPDDAAIAALSAPAAQGSLVQWWTGVIDRATGELVGEPEPRFTGIFDVPRQVIAASTPVTIECGTWAEVALSPRGQMRLTDAFHRSIWGSLELGMIHHMDVTKPVYWRMDDPRDGSYGGSGPWVGGGGFGGGFGGGGFGGGTFGGTTILPSPPPPPPIGDILR